MALLVLSACGEKKQVIEQNLDESQREASHDEHAHDSGDIQEETASADVLPSF